MPDALPDSRDQALERLRGLPAGAIVLLLGAPDTGKTTFVWSAVSILRGEGRNVAVVDCDLGQSEIGAPGTVGVALASPGAEKEPRSLRDLAPLASYFVGAVTPARHMLDVCVGACQMVRVARKRRPDLILIDTDGWTQGGAARLFKRRLAELLLPQAVIALARGDELSPLLTAFGHLKVPELLCVSSGPEIQRKPPAARTTRRAARFLAALGEPHEITLSWDDVSLVGTILGQGMPAPHHVAQFVGQSLRLPVLHVEQSGAGGVYVVVNGERWAADGLAALESHFRTKSITIAPAQKFAGLLLGLVNAQGTLIDIGLLSRLDFRARTVTIRTPCRRPGAVAQIWLGSLRLSPDCREKGETRPGEI
jgi:polynucleotide 5'-hydroxyl-kinase GRC3/NOL9